jgi:hypothetical protein
MEMIVSEFLNTLISLQTGLDKRQMHLLFGKRMGDHLYEKFLRFDRNIVYFYSALDVQNKKIIENAILSARKRCAD